MFSLQINKSVSLELIHPVHAPALFELVEAHREYLSQWMGFVEKTKSLVDVEAFIQRTSTAYGQGKALTCVVMQDQQPVGTVGYNTIVSDLKKGEIGYWLIPTAVGKGIMYHCCQKLIQLGFERLNLNKVEIRAAVENNRSRAVCERLGGRLEGIITQSELLNGTIIDHAVYGVYQSIEK